MKWNVVKMIFKNNKFEFEIDVVFCAVICACALIYGTVYVLDSNITQRLSICTANGMAYSKENQNCIYLEK